MKKLIFIAALVLAGCASQPKVDPGLQTMMDWNKASNAQAESGQMTWEQRFIKSFELAGAIQNPTLRNGFRQSYLEMIPIARKYDAKQMSKAEFEDARRASAMKVEAAFDASNREAAKAKAEYNADMAKILQNNQQQQNQIYQQQMKNMNRPQTSCTSSIYGNTVQTNCN